MLRRASSASECYCAVGIYFDAMQCVACPDGQTSSSGLTSASDRDVTCLDATALQCIAFPEGLTPSRGATPALECYCTGMATISDLDGLLAEHAPHSVYVAEAWDGSGTLYDLSGYGCVLQWQTRKR